MNDLVPLAKTKYMSFETQYFNTRWIFFHVAFINTKIFCGYQSIFTFYFNLFLLISTADHKHLNIYIRYSLEYSLLQMRKPYFTSCTDQTKGGSDYCNIHYSISSVCECVTETDICLTFYAGLNDQLGRERES